MSSHSPFDEVAAVAALRRGSAEALASVYRQYHSRLLILLRQRFYDLPEADHEDIVHNLFIRLEHLIGSYDVQKGGLYPWLARIAVNESRDFRRYNQRYLLLSDAELLLSPDFPEQSVCFRVCMEAALKRCRQAQNHQKLLECLEALCLFAENGCVMETAAVIGRTPRATYEFLSQSRKKLTPYLHPCLSECNALILPELEFTADHPPNQPPFCANTPPSA